MTSRRALGDFGERIAAHKLESLGMRILERNVRVGRIEVDLIAEDGQEVVFVEVRTRRGPAGLAAESVTPQKLRRMWESAAGYCEAHQIPIERMRIDVLAVDLDSSGNARAVEHFPAVEVPADD